MAPVFHTDDNAPGFIMSSVQSPCLLFCPAPSPPLLHTPWLLSFVSLSVTLLPIQCEEKRSKVDTPPTPSPRHAGKCSPSLVGPICFDFKLISDVMHFTFQLTLLKVKRGKSLVETTVNASQPIS